MRRCNICKKQESDLHSEKCSYYWALVANAKAPRVDGDTCYLEDTEGCPLAAVNGFEDCEGCVDCDFD